MGNSQIPRELILLLQVEVSNCKPFHWEGTKFLSLFLVTVVDSRGCN